MATLEADARVTAALVMEIISTEMTTAEINACINTAHHIVEANLEPLGVLTEAVLTDIELWMSAHFVAVRDPRASSERIGQEYQVSYERGASDKGLKATTYGQQALAIDYTGTLESLGLKKAAIHLV